jgi:uncharacterized protein YdbL (DUF1318 family)
MSRFHDVRVNLRVIVAALAIATFVPASIVASVPVCAADLASAKSTVDAAKASGTVGEQADGYLGYVNGSADPATTAAVTAINAARADVYRSTAAKTGVTPEAAGQATGAQLLAKVPPGQFYKPLDGGWAKK